MTEDEIRSLVARFEDGTVPEAEWTHAAHLIVALWYVQHHGHLLAVDSMRRGILHLNKQYGNETGYHETITVAWVTVINAFLAGREPGLSLSRLADLLLCECDKKDYLLRFYSKERLSSDEARRQWVAPDRAKIEIA